MGGAKRLMEEQEQQERVAVRIVVQAGALERCEYHGIVYDAGGGDLEAAYRIGNSKFTAGELKEFRSRRELTDTIKKVYEEAGIECWQCEKMLED
jgi:hypothetical protein